MYFLWYFCIVSFTVITDIVQMVLLWFLKDNNVEEKSYLQIILASLWSKLTSHFYSLQSLRIPNQSEAS